MDTISVDELDANIERLATWITKAKRVLIFAGAGVSTDSGIPTFYGRDGLNNYIKAHQENESAIRVDLVRQFYTEKSLPLNEIKFNASHMAIKKIFDGGYIHKILTVNKDGLFHKVGIPEEHIIEFHGSFVNFTCDKCGKSKRFDLSDLATKYTLFDLSYSYNSKKLVFGECDECKTPLQSTALKFNNPFNKELVNESLDEGIECDLILSIGSSLKILPVASIINIAAIKGKTKFIIIDPEITDLDHLAGLKFDYPCSIILKKLSDVLDKDK